MSSFNIDITGDVNKKMNEITQKVKQAVDDELSAFGFDTVAMAKQLAPADEGILRNRIVFERTELAVEISVAVNYAAYLEFGTRGFAEIYVATLPTTWQEYAATFKGGGGSFENYFQNIFDWCKRKGIEASAAYPIAISILRNGVRPHPYLFPAIDANLIKLKERLKAL